MGLKKIKKIMSIFIAIVMVCTFINISWVVKANEININDGVIGYWNFESFNGKIVTDESSNGKDGELKGNASVTNGGLSGKGLQLTGEKGTFLSIPSIINTAINDFSVSLWVNISNDTSDARTSNTILIQQEETGKSILYWTPPSNGSKLATFIGGTEQKGNATITKGRWYNIVVTGNKATKAVEFYIDGKLDVSNVAPTLVNSAAKLRIGDHKGTDGSAFNGIMDEIRLYNKVLTKSEIEALYLKDSTLDNLKIILRQEISNCTQSLADFPKELNLNLYTSSEKAIENGKVLLDSTAATRDEIISNIDLLKSKKTELDTTLITSLNGMVLVSANINNEVKSVGKELFGVNHRYHKDAYGTYDAVNGKVYDEFDKLYKESAFGSMRYPGGTVSNLFQWKRSIGNVEDRIKTIHGDPSQAPQFPYFGVDEAAKYAEENNSKLIYVYGMGNGSAKDAADLVEYLNSRVGENPNGGTDWAEVRSNNGHPEPYNITAFEIGNEMNLWGQGYWSENVGDRLNAYINGGLITINNELVVDNEDWRAITAKSNGIANQKKYIRYAPVKVGSVSVKIDNTIWTKVDTFAGAGATNVYKLNEETGEIIFGDGLNGNIPTVNKDIYVSYQTQKDGFNDYYREMKKVDSQIKISSCYQDKAFIDRMGTTNPYDGIVVHPYSGTIDSNNSKYYEKILLRSEEKVSYVQSYEEKIKQVLGTEKGKEVKVAVSEYGIYNDSSRFVKSQVNALYTAKSLMGFVDLNVPYTNRHCLVDFPLGDVLGPGQQAVIQSIVDSQTGKISYVATPSAKVFTLFNKMTGNKVINENIINNKQLNISDATNLAAIQTMITTDSEGNVYLMVVNADKLNNTDVIFNLKNYSLNGKEAEVWSVAGESFDSENTISNKDSVSIEKTKVSDLGDNFKYTFKAHSVTAIKISPIQSSNKIEGDFNGNNTVDLGDLSIASKYYGQNKSEYDLNNDGYVNDFEIQAIINKIIN